MGRVWYRIGLAFVLSLLFSFLSPHASFTFIVGMLAGYMWGYVDGPGKRRKYR